MSCARVIAICAQWIQVDKGMFFLYAGSEDSDQNGWISHEPRREKTAFSHMQKQRRRSASR